MLPNSAIKLLIVAAACFLSAFAQNTPASVNRQRLETITRRLTSPEFNGRAFKTEDGHKAAGYLVDLFRDAGLKPVAYRSSYLQQVSGVGLNVVGTIEGRDPARAKTGSDSISHRARMGIFTLLREILRKKSVLCSPISLQKRWALQQTGCRPERNLHFPPAIGWV